MRVKGSYIDRDDKKKSASMDMKAGQRDYANDFIEDNTEVCLTNLYHAYDKCHYPYLEFMRITVNTVNMHLKNRYLVCAVLCCSK